MSRMQTLWVYFESHARIITRIKKEHGLYFMQKEPRNRQDCHTIRF